MKTLSVQEVSTGEEKTTISLNDNVGRRYMFALVQGSTTPTVDIHPLVFNFKEGYF